MSNISYFCIGGKDSKQLARKTYSYLCPFVFVLSFILIILSPFCVSGIYNGSVPWAKELIFMLEYVTVDIKKIPGSNSGCGKLPLPYNDYGLQWEPIANYVLKSHTNSCRCGSEDQNPDSYCYQWCKPVSRVSPDLLLSTWGSVENPYSICKLLYKKQFIEGMLKYNGECPQYGYYQCNSDAPIQMQFCSPFQQICPIYDFVSSDQYNNTGESSFYSFNGQPNPESYFQVEKSSKFFFSKESQKALPASDFRIMDKKAIDFQRQQNKEFYFVDEIRRTDFFQLNVPNEWQVKEAQFGQGEFLSLAYRPFVMIRMHCRQNQFINKLWDQLNLGIQSLLALSLGGILFGISVIFYIIGFLGLICEFKKDQNIDPYEEQCNTGFGLYCKICLCFKRTWKKKVVYDSCTDYCRLIDPCVIFVALSHFLFLLLSFICLTIGSSMAIRAGNFYSHLNDRQCFDDKTNSIVTEGYQEYKKAKIGCIFIIIISTLLTFLVGIVYFSTCRLTTQRRRSAFKRIKELSLAQNSFQTVNEHCLHEGDAVNISIPQKIPGNYYFVEMNSPKGTHFDNKFTEDNQFSLNTCEDQKQIIKKK